MLKAAKRKKQEVAGKIGHDEYAYKIKGEASNLPENRRIREQGELTPYPANYNNNNNNNNENVSRNAIHRPPYGIDEDNNNNSSNSKNVNVTPTPSPFMAGYMSPYPQSPSPALGGPMYNNNSNNYYPSNNNNNYLYRPASTPIPAQSVVPPMPSLPPCPDLPGPLPSVYRPKPPLMLHRGVEGSDNMLNDYVNIYNSGNNNNNYLSPSLTCGVHANVPSALSQTPSLLPQIGKEYLHDNNAPLRIRSAPTPSSNNNPYNNNNNNNGAQLGGGNNGHNVFGVVDEKVDEIQRKLEERRKAQSLQQDNARQMEEQRLRKAAERAKQIQEEREEDERVQRERELVVAKEQTEIAREAYEKQLKENGPIAAEPFRIKYDECQRVQREKEMQQKDYKRISSATQRLAIPSNMALPMTTTTNNPAPLALQKTGEKESIQTLETNNKSQPTLQTTPEPSSSSSSSPSYQPSTIPDGNNQWPQNNPLAAPFTSPTLYDTTNSININSKNNNSKMTLTPLWTPPTPSATPSSHISSTLPTHDMALSLDPSYSNLSGSISNSSNNKLYSALNTHAVSSTLLSTPHLPHTSPLPSSRILPETSKPHQPQLSSSFTYENDTLRDEIHELADNQQRMEHLLRNNEQVAHNITTSSLLPANVLNGLQTNNPPLLNNNLNFNNNNSNFVPNSIINNRRNSNSSNGNSSARRRNGNNNNSNSRSRSNSKNNNNNENRNNINEDNAVVRSSTPNVVMTGNTFLTRNLVTPQPTLNSSNLLCSGSMNSLNGTNNINNSPYDANNTAPFIDNTFVTNTRLAANNNYNDIQDMDYVNNNYNNNGSEGRRRTSLVKFTDTPDETPPFPKDLMVSTRLIGGNENTNGHSVNSIYNNNNNGGELNDALTARGDYLMNLAPLQSNNSDNNMPEIRMLEKELSVEPSLFVGASNTIQKAPQTNPKRSSSNTNANANVNDNTSTSSTSAIKAPVKGNTTTLTLSPRVLANASSSAKQRIIKEEDSSDEEETESDEEGEQ